MRLIAIGIISLAMVGCGGGGTGGDSSATTIGSSGGSTTAVEEEVTGGTTAGSDDGGVGGSTTMNPGDTTGGGLGINEIPGSYCSDGQAIAGVLSNEDLVRLGIITPNPVTVSGSRSGDLSICNLKQTLADGDNGVSLSLTYIDDEDSVQETKDFIVETIDRLEASGSSREVLYIEDQIEGRDVIVSGETIILGQLRYLQSNGLVSTVSLNWIPENNGFSGDESAGQQAILSVLAIIAERGVFEQREFPKPTPWFVCDQNNLGVSGADPATLMGLINAEDGDIRVDIGTSFTGAVSCEAEIDAGRFRTDYSVEISVADFSSMFNGLGTNPVDDFLSFVGDDEVKVQETIDGRVVGVGVSSGFLKNEAEVVAGPDNITVRITVKGPEEIHPQLGDLVRAVANDILPRIP